VDIDTFVSVSSSIFTSPLYWGMDVKIAQNLPLEPIQIRTKVVLLKHFNSLTLNTMTVFSLAEIFF
jgi:predicted naringenin-chalcone synthase